MHRFVLLVSLALVAVLALTAVAGGRASKTVQVADDFFSPDKLTISAGTKVKFNWTGRDEHNVIKKKGPGGPIESPSTDQPGVNLTKKFSKAGTYKLICTLHEDMKMKITVN